MLFINNKYTRTYYSIISNAQSRDLVEGYSEKHHIIPRSLSGTNLKENLVILTAREHFICHWLLPKMLTGNSRSKMIYALFMMNVCNTKQKSARYNTKITSRVYENLRKERSKIITEQLTGRPCTQETRDKISASQKGIPRPNHSASTIAKMRESAKHRPPDSAETRKKKSDARKGKPSVLKGRTLSAKAKEKLRKPKAKASCVKCKKLVSTNWILRHYNSCPS